MYPKNIGIGTESFNPTADFLLPVDSLSRNRIPSYITDGCTALQMKGFTLHGMHSISKNMHRLYC